MDIARRQLDRRLDRLAGVLELVIFLEVGLEPLEDLDRIGDRRLVDIDLLETPDQRAILLEILPIFLIRGRTDAAHRSGRERGLEQIGRIHGSARCGAGADHGVDLVNEQDGARIILELLDHLLKSFLEIASIACPSEQRAHIEREHGRPFEHLRHLAVDDPARQTFCDRRLADAGLANEQRVVLLTPTQHLDGAIDFRVAPDQRVDLAFARLLVEVDAIGLERVAFLLLLIARLGVAVVVDAARRTRLRQARALGDPVADVIDGVVARHLLLLQEIGGMALPLGENRDQHIRAGHLFPPRGLHVNHGALDHPLEAGRRLGILGPVGDEVFEFGFDIGDEVAAQLVGIDIARLHHGSRILIVDQCEQQMLERCVFVVTLVGERQGAMKRLFETA